MLAYGEEGSSMIDGWTPGIGDPTPIGWITVLTYSLAALVCFRAASSVKSTGMPLRNPHRLWLGLGIAMVVMGINKQLDLQSLLTAIGRDLAHRQGWYEARRGVQEAFIAIIVMTGTGLLGFTAIYLCKESWQLKLAGTGLAFLVIFIVVRAASFHHMDVLLRTAFVGMRLNALMELGGIAAIAAGAIGYRVQFANARRNMRKLK